MKSSTQQAKIYGYPLVVSYRDTVLKRGTQATLPFYPPGICTVWGTSRQRSLDWEMSCWHSTPGWCIFSMVHAALCFCLLKWRNQWGWWPFPPHGSEESLQEPVGSLHTKYADLSSTWFMVWKHYCISLLIYCVGSWAVVCLWGSEDHKDPVHNIGPGDRVIRLESRHLYLLKQLDNSNVCVLCIFIFIPQSTLQNLRLYSL